MFQMQETGLQIVSEAVYGEQAASMQSVKPSQESDVKDLFYMQPPMESCTIFGTAMQQSS